VYLRLIIFLLLFSNFCFSKDLILNFEPSCFLSHGAETRQIIIDRAITQLNNLPNNPRRFVLGPDLPEEVDETNFKDYLWSPFSSPILFPFSPIVHRDINPIVCDSDGMILEKQRWFSFSNPINGWANKPRENQYDFFAVYINESYSLMEVCPHEWDDYSNYEDLIIENSTWGEDQIVALLTHELGHVIGLGHTPKEEPANDFPIMYASNFSSSGEFQIEDYDEYERVMPWSYNGKDSIYSFESKVEHSENYLKITVRVNTPDGNKGAEAELLAIAQLKDQEQWWFYNDGNWLPWEDELTGKSVTLNYATDLVVYDGEWGSEEVTIYFGVRVGDTLYYAEDTPIEI